MRTAGLTERLAEVVAAVRFDDLPAAAVAAAQRLVLDWWGVGLAGAVAPAARIVREVAAGLGASGEARVFGAGSASAAGAALANGAAAHVLELDDLHPGSTLHPGAPIIAAALAVAEREHASGTDYLRAVILGYEVALRVGEAVNPSHYRYWHPTGTVATLGAAAAAGSLLGLEREAMLDALGTAGTQAAGLWEFNADGAMSKPLHAGKAAMNGVLAADLARRGFTGAKRILEGDRGFFRAMSVACDPDRVTDGLGEGWKIGETCFKLHACCGHTHTAIDAILELREPRTPETIAIETYGPGYAIVNERNPRSPARAQFSLAYVVAAAWLEGQVGLPQFSADRFGEAGVVEPGIAALLPRIRVRIAEDLTARYPRTWGTRVRVVGADGGSREIAVDAPLGSPENPVSTARLEAKLRGLVGPPQAGAVLDAIAGLLQTSDMGSLADLCYGH